MRAGPQVPYVPKVQINSGDPAGGTFNITASGGRWGTAEPHGFWVTNFGTVAVTGNGTASILGDYFTHDSTTITTSTLEIVGYAEQGPNPTKTPTWTLLEKATVKAREAGHVLGIRNGLITGDGTVDGNLCLGHNPDAPGYTGQQSPAAEINPRGPGAAYGVINVKENFHIFAGKMTIDVNGVADDHHDRVIVTGYAALPGTVEGVFTAAGLRIGGGQKVVFLYANNIPIDFTGHTLPPGWTKAHAKVAPNPAEYWFQAPPGQVMGRVGRDENGNGAFEPLDGDVGLAGVPVFLAGPDGLTDQVETDADGWYDFGAVPFGTYEVTVGQPAGLRPSPQHASAATPETDSDIDVNTLLAAVTLDAADPFSTPRTDALFRPNVLPAAADDAAATPYQTAVSGNVLANDTDADGDTLTVVASSAPSSGSVTVAADGSYTYTPAAGFVGTATFTYTVADGFGGTATATVTVTVNPPAAGAAVTTPVSPP